MSITSLLNQPLTIQRQGPVGTDEYNNEVVGTTSTFATTGYVEQTEAKEVTVDRETYTTDWLVVLFPDVAIDGSDHIAFGTQTFLVVGSPHTVWNPRTRVFHHIECNCVEITG